MFCSDRGINPMHELSSANVGQLLLILIFLSYLYLFRGRCWSDLNLYFVLRNFEVLSFFCISSRKDIFIKKINPCLLYYKKPNSYNRTPILITEPLNLDLGIKRHSVKFIKWMLGVEQGLKDWYQLTTKVMPTPSLENNKL